MAYFLKKSNFKKGTYLQIYESFYDPNRGHTAHRSYRAIGYVHELMEKGIADPIAYYREEVNQLNEQRKSERKESKKRLIANETPEKYVGYFPVKAINDNLGVKKYIDLMQSVTNFRFSIYDMISALVYSRMIAPCSKSKTFDEVIPRLYETFNVSLSQIYSGLEYIGQEYEKIIEIYNHQISQQYNFDTKRTYFDCTNFYFEIDKEDDFRKKGPSKENRKEPIVGLGLLLDANQIPIGMKLFPGNESEKPILRSVINDLKQRNNISGRTIQVSDKGLNCAENILHALKSGDGYIFSKSVKQLPETEKVWVLLSNDYQDVKDENGELLYRIKECIDDFEYTVTDENGKKKKIKLPEKRVVTYNPKLAQKQIYEINKQIEKARILRASHAKRDEYGDCVKYVKFITTDKSGNKTDNKIQTEMNEDAIQKDIELAGYNLLVTSEIKMKSKEIYQTYHNLWRIEESFRIMKSQLDARPVYLQKEDTITGHFLICYLAVTLLRLLQFKVLKNQYSSETILDFIKNFKVVQIDENTNINLTRYSTFISDLTEKTGLPLTSYYLTSMQIEKMLNLHF